MDIAILLPQLTAAAAQDNIEQLVVGAVIGDQNAVLLLHRPVNDFMGGIYELPSGKVELGETLDVALTREVKEETGLDVTGVTGYLGYFDYRSGSGRKSRQFTFSVDVAAREPLMLTEHDNHRWVSPTDEAPVTDAVKGVLSQYCVSERRAR